MLVDNAVSVFKLEYINKAVFGFDLDTVYKDVSKFRIFYYYRVSYLMDKQVKHGERSRMARAKRAPPDFCLVRFSNALL